MPGQSVQGITEDIRAFHDSAVVADAHGDPLLWNRDLLAGSEKAQVDLPKLRAGSVDIQTFWVVTRGLPWIDGFRWYARFRNGWPKWAARDEVSRARYQIERLERLEEQAHERFAIARISGDFRGHLDAGRTVGVLGIEGVHAVGGDLSNLRAFYERGARIVGVAHLDNNEYGGSSWRFGGKKGLTREGRAAVEEIQRLGMILDLSHDSDRAFEDILEMTGSPVFISHTCADAVHPHWRNHTDEQARKVAARGGVVSVMLATHFLGGSSLNRLADHIEHLMACIGPDHVAIGSDLDGFIPLPRGFKSSADYPQITSLLLDRGFGEGNVRKIIGENLLRFYERSFPSGQSGSSASV